MGNEQVIEMIRDQLGQINGKLDEHDRRQQQQGEALVRIQQRLDGLPCQYCLKKIDEHEAALNKGKGVIWAGRVAWAMIAVAAGFVAKYLWR